MKFTVIGNPVIHSLSPWIHQEFAKQFNLSIVYTKTEAPLDQFQNVVYAFQTSGGTGANITMPFKQEAYQMANQLTQRAENASAVNTLRFDENGLIEADNTDGIGFITDIQFNQNFSLNNKNILILGAGGAARGILSSLLEFSPKKIVIANRTFTTALHLAKAFSDYQNISASLIQDVSGEFDLMINATSFSSWPLKLPTTLTFSANSMAYDLKYQAHPTGFMQWATQNGVKYVHDGIGMLAEQAAESFYYWTELRPDTAAIIATLRTNIKD